MASDQEIEDIPSGAVLLSVKLAVTALSAGDNREFLVLDIEDLGEISSCRLYLIHFVMPVSAFRAYVLYLFHANLHLQV